MAAAAKTLRERRESLGLSHQEVARVARVPTHAVLTLEAGQAPTALCWLDAWAAALGMELHIGVRPIRQSAAAAPIAPEDLLARLCGIVEVGGDPHAVTMVERLRRIIEDDERSGAELRRLFAWARGAAREFSGRGEEARLWRQLCIDLGETPAYPLAVVA